MTNGLTVGCFDTSVQLNDTQGAGYLARRSDVLTWEPGIRNVRAN
jgi:hypothetical protein